MFSHKYAVVTANRKCFSIVLGVWSAFDIAGSCVCIPTVISHLTLCGVVLHSQANSSRSFLNCHRNQIKVVIGEPGIH